MFATQSQERRRINRDIDYFWQQLSLAQKFAVSELQRYGYQLQFVRNMAFGKIAVLDFDGKLAAIDHQGEIDTTPNIVLRH